MPKKKKEDKKIMNDKKESEKMLKSKISIPPKKSPKWLIFLIIIALALTIMYPSIIWEGTSGKLDVWLNDFTKSFEINKYSEVVVDDNKLIWKYREKEFDKSWKEIWRDVAILPPMYSLSDLWLLDNISETYDGTTKVEVKDLTSKRFWSNMIPTILTLMLFIAVAIFLINRMWWAANNAMSFGRSRAKLYDKSKNNVTFADVAWAAEEKQELTEIVDFLKNPKKYKDIWAKIPKWVLLVWPPWTGKTLIARAVAGESGVPFLTISWSEFVEMFVWVWASRVRDLFDQAKKLSPSIIFIDEIDAIGKKRGPGLGGGHDEREQTLNQILTEMDGFDQDTNVIVMAATNRSDVLDRALLRPGRFDRKVTINLPNLEDRKKILEVHSKWKPMSENFDYKSLASKTVWFSWADLWNLLNEAAILTARRNEKIITNAIVTESFEKLVMWLTKKSQVFSEHEKAITAYHEVWHALVWQMLPNTDTVHKISIVSRWSAWWVTWFLPERDRVYVSKAKFLDEIATLYGWRVAEEIFFGADNITTWASNDIEKATNIARDMVMRYGMFSDIWAENFAWDSARWNYLWDEWWQKPFGQKTQDAIDNKVRDVLQNAYNTARDIITKYKDLHDEIAKDLLEKEEISEEEFKLYFA